MLLRSFETYIVFHSISHGLDDGYDIETFFQQFVYIACQVLVVFVTVFEGV